MEKEYRNYGIIREFDEESRLITGYALKFDSESQYMGFYEKIDRSAISPDLLVQCDIFALLNHDENKVLARSRYGEGSLKLELDDEGLYYEFEAPKTQYGDELIEHLKRGEIFASSFGCYIDPEGDIKTRDEKGIIHRTITKITRLFDVSPVFEPAYLSTNCTKRTLEIMEEMKELKEKKEEVEDIKEEQPKNEEESTEEQPKEEEKELEDEKDGDNDNNNSSDDNTNSVDKDNELEDDSDVKEEEEKKEKKSKTEKNIDIKFNMENTKNFSLLRAIKSVVDGKQFDAVDNSVMETARAEFRNAGRSYEGQIQLPYEKRSVVTVNVEGEDVVATDVFDILTPLRAKNVLLEAGADFYPGLINNVKIPVMTANNVFWEGETAPAQDGAGTFTHVELSPKRLTAYVDISKQFLIQTENIQAEAKIRQDIIDAVSNKLEATILGDAAGTTTQPAGIFNGATVETIADFKDITELEAGVEEVNVYGDLKYVISPKAKAALRNMARSADNTRLVMEGGEIDGTATLVTSNVPQQKLAYGNWKDLKIGQWGGIDLSIDPFTQATNGCVRLVINCYFDAKVARPEAFAFGTTAE